MTMSLLALLTAASLQAAAPPMTMQQCVESAIIPPVLFRIRTGYRTAGLDGAADAVSGPGVDAAMEQCLPQSASEAEISHLTGVLLGYAVLQGAEPVLMARHRVPPTAIDSAWRMLSDEERQSFGPKYKRKGQEGGVALLKLVRLLKPESPAEAFNATPAGASPELATQIRFVEDVANWAFGKAAFTD